MQRHVELKGLVLMILEINVTNCVAFHNGYRKHQSLKMTMEGIHLATESSPN